MRDAIVFDIAAELNTLLEAERAGTRVALTMRKESATSSVADFMARIEKDEAHWCAMLKRQIESLGADASTACGDFYDKVIAIEDTTERLRLLNRGQRWVVRRIEALLPRLNDQTLFDALGAMAEQHRVNIAATDDFMNSQES